MKRDKEGPWEFIVTFGIGFIVVFGLIGGLLYYSEEIVDALPDNCRGQGDLPCEDVFVFYKPNSIQNVWVSAAIKNDFSQSVHIKDTNVKAEIRSESALPHYCGPWQGKYLGSFEGSELVIEPDSIGRITCYFVWPETPADGEKINVDLTYEYTVGESNYLKNSNIKVHATGYLE